MIETERLVLEPFSEAHLTERYVGWLNDPVVVRYSQQRFRQHTLASCRAYWESFAGSDDEFWAIVARDEALGHIGNLTIARDVRHGVADIAILVGERAVWGRGYAFEAWTAMCADLFRRGARKITAGTLSTNDRMLALMRRAGMEPDGTRRRHEIFEGREVDVVFAAVFRDGAVQSSSGVSGYRSVTKRSTNATAAGTSRRDVSTTRSGSSGGS